MKTIPFAAAHTYIAHIPSPPPRNKPKAREEIKILYEKGLLTMCSPEALLKMLWLNNTVQYRDLSVLNFIGLLLSNFKLTTFYSFDRPICAICLPNESKKISVPMK